MVVVLDVVPGDLEVAHLRTLDANPAQPVVTDVTAGNVDLMQVHAIEINAGTGIEIHMAMTDQDVPIALNEMDTVPTTRHHYALEHRLHGLDQFKPIGLRMRPFHFNVFYRWHPLMGRDIALSTLRIACSAMRANQAKGGSLACHHHARRATRTINSKRTTFGKVDLYRRSNAVGSGRKMQDAISIGNCMHDGIGVVALAVPDCSKSHHVAHLAKLGSTELCCQHPTEMVSKH